VLSPIQHAEREDAIADWLADHGIDTAFAGPLAETAVTLDALDRMAAAVSGPLLAAVLRWEATGCSVRALAAEIQEAAQRITGLVAAVKGFTHMDQATVAGPVDLTSGLGNTIAVLKSKARAKSVAVTIDVQADLPRVRGFAGELNQIWVNLIDNALDAVADAGRVEVTAKCERHRVVVRIIDNGPGIPAEIRERLFEPFVTTKPVGKGTGLGLSVSYGIIESYGGTIGYTGNAWGGATFYFELPVAEPSHAMDADVNADDRTPVLHRFSLSRIRSRSDPGARARGSARGNPRSHRVLSHFRRPAI
jgi:signal transduction histidine kinase